ncbi:MAG: hypothetical protein ACE5F1_21430 [Planctomycetota bacterium]
MSYDPRTIALLSEIIHPPIELNPTAIQTIHNQLFGHREFSYQNFAVAPDGISLSNATETPGSVSLINFMADRIQVREELTGAHIDDFCRRIEYLASISLAELSMPILATNFHDSREFLSGGVCGLHADAFEPFERPMGLFGMKMIFPVIDGEADFHTLRIESFNQDPRSVFIENVSTFTSAVMPDHLEEIGASMRRTYDFLRHKGLSFLATYDRSEKERGAG